VLPARKLVAGVELDRGGCHRRRPPGDGRIHSRMRGALDLLVALRLTIRGDGPAIVVTGLDAVEFIAAARAVFGRPELARHRMKLQPLHVTVAVTPDRFAGAGLADEGVVRRNPAVVEDAVNFSERALDILRADGVAAFADG